MRAVTNSCKLPINDSEISGKNYGLKNVLPTYMDHVRHVQK